MLGVGCWVCGREGERTIKVGIVLLWIMGDEDIRVTFHNFCVACKCGPSSRANGPNPYLLGGRDDE